MIKSLKISYKELFDNTYKDKYIAQNNLFHQACDMTENLREALLLWHCNNDDNKTAMHIITDDANEVGRSYMFGNKIKAGDKVLDVQCFFALEALEQYRNEGVGTSLMLYPLSNKEYDYVLIAGMTDMVVPIYRKLKYYIFEIPQYIKLINSRYILMPLGLKGWILNCITGLCNGMLKIMNVPNIIKSKQLNKKYILKKENIVPKWAGELATNDGHKYMELHDREWLQWNLDHNTNGFKEDIQSFYSVYDRNETPLGFFMTKERFIKEAGRIKDSLRGTVVEWGSYNEKVLNESDINILALQTFSKNVDLVVTLAGEEKTKRTLKRMGFIQRGFFYVGIRDKKNILKDASDQQQWRLRYGYTNTILY